jgi:N-acyl-D-amino-acid deacylase
VIDLLIRGGDVLDGTGAPAQRADVAIDGGRIVAVTTDREAAPDARRVIDADGLTVAPGFIDLHSHSDFSLPTNPGALNSISQGVTTEILGNCGYSPAPLAHDPRRRAEQIAANSGLGLGLACDWWSFGEFADVLDEAKPAVDCALLVGHGTVRLAVVGGDDREATPAELDRMRGYVADALAAGAVGMSSGLVYPPGSYASTDELVQVGEPLRGGAGVYASHIRSEGFGLLDAIREAIDIGRRLETTVEVSHLKAAGLPNHGKSTEALAILDAARAEGLEVGNDAYPYLAGSTLLTQLLPPWVQDGGTDALVERLRSPEIRARVTHDVEDGVPGWMSYSVHSGGFDKITISGVGTPALQHLEGRTLAESAALAGKAPLDLVYDTLVEDHGATVMIVTLMADEDVETILRHASTGIGSDQLGVTSPTARVHPRCYGTFARVLGWGVRERGLTTLPDAIRRMTSLAAGTMGLHDRGRLAPGLQADVVVFDPARIADTATYEEPTRLAVGVEATILRGGVAMEHGEVVDAHLGRVVRVGRPA